MDFKQLFGTQRKLDERIVEEKRLEGQDLLDEKILALQVELGELANEWRGFKFWSNDQEPRGYNIYAEGKGIEQKNPLLEEYVDCLHFILSIGNEFGFNDITEEWISERGDYSEEYTKHTFIMLMKYSSDLYNYEDDMAIKSDVYEVLFLSFVALGLEERHLGFTWQQIKQAYYDKNKTNHERQDNGY